MSQTTTQAVLAVATPNTGLAHNKAAVVASIQNSKLPTATPVSTAWLSDYNNKPTIQLYTVPGLDTLCVLSGDLSVLFGNKSMTIHETAALKLGFGLEVQVPGRFDSTCALTAEGFTLAMFRLQVSEAKNPNFVHESALRDHLRYDGRAEFDRLTAQHFPKQTGPTVSEQALTTIAEAMTQLASLAKTEGGNMADLSRIQQMVLKRDIMRNQILQKKTADYRKLTHDLVVKEGDLRSKASGRGVGDEIRDLWNLVYVSVKDQLGVDIKALTPEKESALSWAVRNNLGVTLYETAYVLASDEATKDFPVSVEA